MVKLVQQVVNGLALLLPFTYMAWIAIFQEDIQEHLEQAIATHKRNSNTRILYKHITH